MFSVSVPIIFEISTTGSVVESILIKRHTKFPALSNPVKNSVVCIGMFQKVALLEFSEILF